MTVLALVLLSKVNRATTNALRQRDCPLTSCAFVGGSFWQNCDGPYAWGPATGKDVGVVVSCRRLVVTIVARAQPPIKLVLTRKYFLHLRKHKVQLCVW